MLAHAYLTFPFSFVIPWFSLCMSVIRLGKYAIVFWVVKRASHFDMFIIGS